MDILRSTNVEIRINETNVEVSRPGRTWRLDDANRIVIGKDAHQRRVILGIGADAAVSEQGGQPLRAFDAARFDPDVSTSATRWWSYRGVTAEARHETFAFVFTRPVLHIFWPAWDAIPFEARRRYLNLVAHWADVVMNGHRAATRPLSRRLIDVPRWE